MIIGKNIKIVLINFILINHCNLNFNNFKTIQLIFYKKNKDAHISVVHL